MDVPQLVELLESAGEVAPAAPAAPAGAAPAAPAPAVSAAAAAAGAAAPAARIPVTIVTGYLGSGKSTLLEHIGRTSSKRLAIILNEFGDLLAIEKAVTIRDSDTAVQEWLDLGNGCLCCTVKDNGVAAIEQLVESSRGKIDYILLETTGVADPAPIAKMFWLDEGLGLLVYIDGVVTVADSLSIVQCLDDVGGHWHRAHRHLLSDQSANVADLTDEELAAEGARLAEGMSTAHLQLALADTILINKVDTVSDDALRAATDRVRAVNATAPLYTTSFGDIALDKILDLHAFEPRADKFALAPSVVHDASFHDSRIATTTLEFAFFTSARGFERVEQFLRQILWELQTLRGDAIEVHRVKGVLVCGDDVRVVQGVRDTYDIIEGATLVDGITCNKIVLIGKGLNHEAMTQELQTFLEA